MVKHHRHEEEEGGFKLFEEFEPGKPYNWGCTVTIIVLICCLNIAILIGLRTVLEMKDQFEEPLLSGATRDLVIEFLGLFALSFGFGCCCCFCCACKCPGLTWRGCRKGVEIFGECIARPKVHDEFYRTNLYSRRQSSDSKDGTALRSFNFSTQTTTPPNGVKSALDSFEEARASQKPPMGLDPTEVRVVAADRYPTSNGTTTTDITPEPFSLSFPSFEPVQRHLSCPAAPAQWRELQKFARHLQR